MNTPTEAQLKDPTWWDDRAGTATHYCTDIGQFLDYNRHYALSGKSCCVPRPTTPPSPEWDGEGLPPVGSTQDDCELVGMHQDTERFEVVAHRNGAAIVYVPLGDEDGDAFPALPCHFRPLRTKEQWERGELKMIIKNWSGCPVEAVADAIIAAGWHKSKGEPGVDDSPRVKGFVCGEAYRRLPNEEKASMEWQAHAERIISHLYDAGMLRKAGEK